MGWGAITVERKELLQALAGVCRSLSASSSSVTRTDVVADAASSNGDVIVKHPRESIKEMVRPHTGDGVRMSGGSALASRTQLNGNEELMGGCCCSDGPKRVSRIKLNNQNETPLWEGQMQSNKQTNKIKLNNQKNETLPWESHRSILPLKSFHVEYNIRSVLWSGLAFSSRFCF